MSQPLRRSPRLNPGLQDKDRPTVILYKRTYSYEPSRNTYFDDLIASFVVSTIILWIGIIISALIWPQETFAVIRETLNSLRQY